MLARCLTSALAVGLLAIAWFMVAMGRTQQPISDETARGISLQQQGKTEEALASLRATLKRNKNDLMAWHYLGLAFEQKGNLKEARKAHEQG